MSHLIFIENILWKVIPNAHVEDESCELWLIVHEFLSLEPEDLSLLKNK